MDITQLLAFSVKNKASDLHLSAGLPPMLRVHGDVKRINLPVMEHKEVHAMVYDIMSDTQRKQYEENRSRARRRGRRGATHSANSTKKTWSATFLLKSMAWHVSVSMHLTKSAALRLFSVPFPARC